MMDAPPLDFRVSPSKLRHDEKAYIMPFFVKENVHVAPYNRFHPRSLLDLDSTLSQAAVPSISSVNFRIRRRACPIRSVKQIVNSMNGTEDAPIDLTGPANPLTKVPFKFLCYREDVRPPYQGTYTRPLSARTARKLAVTPFHRGLPDTDYDYDSEAEWAEPEEGDEEVLDDDSESEEEDGDEEMADFLDDEGDVTKRQQVQGNMQAVCSGLYWEGQSNHQDNETDLSQYRMDVLHDSTHFPIDPFSTSHWSDLVKRSPVKREEKAQQSGAMQPPRVPLMAVSPNAGNLITSSAAQTLLPGIAKPENATSTKVAKSAGAKKSVKCVPSELIADFKAAVVGSTYTKLGLLEMLKTQFPMCTKPAIKNTLEDLAERKDQDGEKKWVLKEA
jgi:chromatin assembly factor 1 subunit A